MLLRQKHFNSSEKKVVYTANMRSVGHDVDANAILNDPTFVLITK